jgi:hypothetical protein
MTNFKVMIFDKKAGNIGNGRELKELTRDYAAADIEYAKEYAKDEIARMAKIDDVAIEIGDTSYYHDQHDYCAKIFEQTLISDEESPNFGDVESEKEIDF